MGRLNEYKKFKYDSWFKIYCLIIVILSFYLGTGIQNSLHIATVNLPL